MAELMDLEPFSSSKRLEKRRPSTILKVAGTGNGLPDLSATNQAIYTERRARAAIRIKAQFSSLTVVAIRKSCTAFVEARTVPTLMEAWCVIPAETCTGRPIGEALITR